MSNQWRLSLVEEQTIIETSLAVVEANFSDVDFTDANEFKANVDKLLPLDAVNVQEVNSGADRHQAIFTFANELYVLHCEILSMSIWIEAMQPDTDIQRLFSILS
ncbi:MAG: DUF3630 family protein [Alteromonadaceae bacterium]|nr:DUF3630 family protein [Alteromonadaceae bacterium]